MLKETPQPKYLSVRNLAQRWSVSRNYVLTRVADNRIKGNKVDGKWFIPLSYVEEHEASLMQVGIDTSKSDNQAWEHPQDPSYKKPKLENKGKKYHDKLTAGYTCACDSCLERALAKPSK